MMTSNSPETVETVIVTMVFDAADPASLSGVLARYVVTARGVDGCRNIDLCASTTATDRYVVISKWASPEAQRRHFDSPAMVERSLTEVAGLTHAAQLSQVRLLPDEQAAQKDLFPQGKLDKDLQQVDLRSRNSWRLLLAEVPTVELLEVQLVNAVAPFIRNARLKPLMLRTPNTDKHNQNRTSHDH